MGSIWIAVENDGYGADPGEFLFADEEELLWGFNGSPGWEAFLDCPLDNIPEGATIDSAILYLQVIDYWPWGNWSWASPVTEPWTELSALCPAYDQATSTLFSLYNPVIYLTDLVRDWQTGARPNYGVAIWGPSPRPSPYRAHSRESGILTYWHILYTEAGGGGGGDTQDPVVEITSPNDGETISGDVEITATATDNVGVTTVQCYVDGQPVGEALAEPNYYGAYRWTWDSCPWANGSHTIEVKAWDAAGNMGSDSITVTLNNSLADNTKILYTKQMPADMDGWDLSSRYPDLGLIVLDATDPPANPAKVYNVQAFCHVPGNTIDLDEYQPVELNRAHGFAAQANTIRWALKAEPLQVLAFYESGCAGIVALCEYPTSLAAVLTDTPKKLFSFDGGALTELLDLSGWSGTPRDVCYVDGKLLVAIGSTIVVYDVDSGQEELTIDLSGVTTVRQIELRGTTQAWIAADTPTGGRLFSFSYPTTTQIGDVEQILALEAYESAVAIGCAGGKVYTSYGSTPTLAHDTGETNVLGLHDVSGTMLAGTSANGKVFRSQPSWMEDADFGFSDVAALGQYQAKAYAGGNSAQLWRRDAADTWAQDRILDATTAINALLEHTAANGAVSLLIGTSGANARLYRLELSNVSRLQTGVDPPDCVFKLLRTVEA